MAQLTAGEIAAAVAGEMQGDAGRVITGVAALVSAQPHELSFVANTRYLAYLHRTRAGVVLTPRALAESVPEGIARVVVEDPHVALYRVLRLLHPARPRSGQVHPTAVVDPTAELGEAVSVGPYAVVGARSRVGAGCYLGAHVVVGEDCLIGEECTIHPQATLHDGVTLGAR